MLLSLTKMNGKEDDFGQLIYIYIYIYIYLSAWLARKLPAGKQINRCIFIFTSLVGEKIDEKCFSFPLVNRIWSLVLCGLCCKKLRKKKKYHKNLILEI